MTDILSNVDTIKFTENDWMILEYVKSNREKVIWMTLLEISNKLYISNASIVRFCQKIGYAGFLEFKFKLRNATSIEGNSIQDILPVLAARYDDTISNIDEESINRIKDSILTCNPFYIYGRNLSSIPAKYLYDMLTTMDIPCMMVDWIDTLKSLSETITSKSLILMMSEHCHEEYIPIVNSLHNRGAIVIWICSSPVTGGCEKIVDLYIDTFSNNEQTNKLANLVILQTVIELIDTQKVPS